MKNSLFLITLGLLISMNVLGQTEVVSKRSQGTIITNSSELHSNLDLTIGYVPKSSCNALKTSFSANNILLKRVGVYASLERGLDSDYFTNIFGITSSVNRIVYLWGGIGFFGKYGLSNKIGRENTRKELGIGLTPYNKMSVIRLGWSFGIGPTVSAGIKIPI